LSWIRYNGKILKKDNRVAVDLSCCCTDECTQCPAGQPSMGDPHTLPVINTLYARITAVLGCGCLDGICIPLLWSNPGNPGFNGGGSVWQGTIAIPLCTGLPVPDRFITLALTCCGATNSKWYLGSDDCTAGATPAIGGPCPDIQLPLAFSTEVEHGWSCRPYDMTFLNMPGLTCCALNPSTYRVRVTETVC
jgi:hypothetical protein